MKRLNIIFACFGAFYWTQVGCGPLGNRIAVELAACTIKTASDSATDILGRLDDSQTKWDGYVAASVATKAGANFLYCGLSHLLTELDRNKMASNDDTFCPSYCHSVEERHRSRLNKTLLRFKVRR